MDKRALSKYLLALLLFGSNGIMASHIALESSEIVFMRSLLGGALLLALTFASGGLRGISAHRRDLAFVVASGVALAANWLFLYEAYRQIGVGAATLLCYCGPVIVMAISPLIFRERLTLWKVAGFAIVVVGAFLVIGGTGTTALNPWGIACGLLSALSYAVMIVFNKQPREVVGLPNAAVQLVAAFITVAIFLGARQQLAIQVPVESWLWILILGLVNTGLGCYLYFSPLSKLPVQTVAVCGYLEPLSAVVMSALILGEQMTVLQIIGAACVIGGALLAELKKMTPAKF